MVELYGCGHLKRFVFATPRVDAGSSNTDKLDEIQRQLRAIECVGTSDEKDDIEMTDTKQNEIKTSGSDVHVAVTVPGANGVDQESDARTSLIQGQ